MNNEEKIAIIFEGEKITYSQLESEIKKRVKQIEKLSINKGRVGLMFERGPEYLYWVCVLLKLKICFVPLSHKSTDSFLNYVIKNAELDFVIADKNRILDTAVYVEGKEWIVKRKKNIICNRNKLAYIMYTSGTTGAPKGVMISRAALYKFTEIFMSEEIKEGDIFLANTSFTFDISIVELVLPIIKGGTIYLSSEKEQKNPKAIAKIIKMYKFDWVQFTPSYLCMLLKYNDSINCLNCAKNIIVGGEQVPKTLVMLLKEKTKSNLYNAYGPTEATIWSHVGNLRTRTINVGNALNGIKEYIMDENMSDTDYGVLWLGGETLANGYVNNTSLTKEKFVSKNGELIYNTGDVVYRNEEGLVICGRVDNQVKILGKRIELEEIECIVLENMKILQCIVLVVYGELTLIVIDSSITQETLKKKLDGKVENALIPKKIMYLKEFPLMSNGKIDRRKVRDDVMNKLNLDQQVVNVVKEYTGEGLSLNSRLDEIGLNSLEYISLLVRLEKLFKIEFEDERLIMEAFGTIRELVDYVKELVKEK